MSAPTQAASAGTPAPEALTIHQAAQTTGWSARMLRYVERIGLVEPTRSESGYRLYGPAELQRLGTLRELLHRFGIGLGDVGFALRLRREAALRDAVEGWLSARAERPRHVSSEDWLGYEQAKHERLLSTIAASDGPSSKNVKALRPSKEIRETP
jgi:MerR family transcriptional regulator, copper efflux regulator